MRTKQFELQIIRAYDLLPKPTEAQIIGRQMLRSGTSVSAQYREANRVKPDNEWIAIIVTIVLKRKAALNSKKTAG
jgi:four helix bundle protein